MMDTEQLTTEAAEPIVTEADSTSAEVAQEQPRDFEAEARTHGWTPKEEFRGDPNKWVDAETFVRRADEVMPFLKKQNAALKRELDDVKRQVKKASEYFTKAEERAYQRAMAELQAKHDEAVESGDVAASRRVLKEMDDLKAEVVQQVDKPKDTGNPNKEFAEWVENNDWYILDDKKRAYADLQAGAMGPATEWDGGPKAWLEELGKRVERKFAEKKPALVNPGGNRSSPPGGGKTYNDLPAQAKAICDKWVKNGIIKDRAAYVNSYPWD